MYRFIGHVCHQSIPVLQCSQNASVMLLLVLCLQTWNMAPHQWIRRQVPSPSSLPSCTLTSSTQGALKIVNATWGISRLPSCVSAGSGWVFSLGLLGLAALISMAGCC